MLLSRALPSRTQSSPTSSARCKGSWLGSRQKYEQLRQDATTAQYLEITTKYTDLQRAHAEAQQQLAVVSEAYTSLKSSTRIGWFLSGAGVILMGWILGMASERWRGRRRRSAGSSYQLPH